MTNAMTPIDWAKRPIEKYADFSGRAPRAEYWWYTLGLVVVYLVLSIVESIVGLSGMFGGYGLLTLLFILATIVPGIAVTARRLHDTGRSGWWMLIAIVPYILVAVMAGAALAGGSMGALAGAGLLSFVALIGAVVLLVFMVLAGTPGDNRYGPNPYGHGAGDTVAAE